MSHYFFTDVISIYFLGLGQINSEDPNLDKTFYTRFGAYSRSKLANILFAKELGKRLAGNKTFHHTNKSTHSIYFWSTMSDLLIFCYTAHRIGSNDVFVTSGSFCDGCVSPLRKWLARLRLSAENNKQTIFQKSNRRYSNNTVLFVGWKMCGRDGLILHVSILWCVAWKSYSNYGN